MKLVLLYHPLLCRHLINREALVSRRQSAEEGTARCPAHSTPLCGCSLQQHPVPLFRHLLPSSSPTSTFTKNKPPMSSTTGFWRGTAINWITNLNWNLTGRANSAHLCFSNCSDCSQQYRSEAPAPLNPCVFFLVESDLHSLLIQFDCQGQALRAWIHLSSIWSGPGRAAGVKHAGGLGG